MTNTNTAVRAHERHIRVSRITVDGVSMFYREAGSSDSPVMLLLHGFPSSSFMYRNLMPILAEHFRVIAPDFPGFGFTEVPEDRNYTYTFASLAKTTEAFLDELKIKKFSVYIFDYGAPIGLRLAINHPERIEGLVSQNGNAYEEGFGEFWAPIKKYWQDQSRANREALRPFTAFEATKWQYTQGVPNTCAMAPESYTLDAALMQRPGNADIQLDLFLDYATNVSLYPRFQEFIRTTEAPLLVIWGKHDPIFIAPGAEAFRRDNPKAQIELLDTGHFALETHSTYIGEEILTHFGRESE
jgi:pimeloyl-ACP methyl ester carboxylesterase